MISADASYRLIYAQSPFQAHTIFLQGLQERFPTVEIPYLDASDLPEDVRDPLDQCLYVLNDANASRVVAAIKAAASRGRAFPSRLEDLGVVPGRDVAEMLRRFRTEQEAPAESGGWFRVQSGLYRNLIVKVSDREPAAVLPAGEAVPESSVMVEYTLFGSQRYLVVEKVNLASTRTPVDPLASFTAVTGLRSRKAVILDADTELREACCRCDNLYTRPDPEEVARAIAEGWEPPQWGRYVGASQAFYFTISRFRLLYSEFELHVVFDEREGGPRSAQGSDSFRAAYMQNREWVKRFVRACGLHMYDTPGDRSEDVIGSLVHRMTGELGYSEVVIATKGTDLYPLVSDKVRLTLPKLNFRDHPQTVTPREALAKFGLSDAAQLPRIYWLRALTGDVSGTPSVNLFNKQAGHRYTNIRQTDYLPHVLSAADLTDLKLRLLAFEAFHPFVSSGQFDRNLAALTLDTTKLDGADLASFRVEERPGVGRVDPHEVRKLLEENLFFKEIEYLEWSLRVIKGLW